MKKSTTITLTILSAVVASACKGDRAAAGPNQASKTTRVCVERATNRVVSNVECSEGRISHAGYHSWYYAGSFTNRNGVMYAADGSFNPPSARAAGGTSADRAHSTTRGGFGRVGRGAIGA